ncbi:hypothetical protein GDO86_011156, partial [Hymenochirus boettgeri]
IATDRMVDTILELKRNLTLDCLYPEDGIMLQFSWVKVKEYYEDRLCAVNPHFGKDIAEKYKGRVVFVNGSSSSRDASITLAETSEEDVGVYNCYLSIFQKGTFKKVIAVQSGELRKIAASTQLEFRINQKIILNFQSVLGGSVKQVVLEKYTPGRMDTIALCNEDGLPKCGFNYISCTFLVCSDPSNISLLIKNLTSKEEGLYVCHFTTKNGTDAVATSVHIRKGK